MKYFIILVTAILFSGCIANSNPHQVFIDRANSLVSRKPNILNFTQEALSPPNKGEVSSNGAMKIGDGLTHITKNKDGTLIYHFFEYEKLKNPSLLFYEQKGIKGKCLIYYVVDPKTGIIIDWGFDEGGNPKACAITG